ncbi:MAG: hypothetical protein HY291_11820 [Planctomycetes bacterium]|nr:hypothetical protein [Planctomycetota bacterium]
MAHSLCVLIACVCCTPTLWADEPGAGANGLCITRWIRADINPRKPLTPPPPQEEKPKPPTPPAPQKTPAEDAVPSGTNGTPSGSAADAGEEQSAAGAASRNENAEDSGGSHLAGFYSLVRSPDPWPLSFLVLLVVLNVGAFAAAGSLIKREPESFDAAPAAVHRLEGSAALARLPRAPAPRTKAAPVLNRNVHHKSAPPAVSPKPAPPPVRAPAPTVAARPAPVRVQPSASAAPRIARPHAAAAMLVRKKKLS